MTLPELENVRYGAYINRNLYDVAYTKNPHTAHPNTDPPAYTPGPRRERPFFVRCRCGIVCNTSFAGADNSEVQADRPPIASGKYRTSGRCGVLMRKVGCCFRNFGCKLAISRLASRISGACVIAIITRNYRKSRARPRDQVFPNALPYLHSH